MNIIKKLSLRHLKKNKNRSALTVLGITVSVVLMTALVVAASSFLHYYGAKSVYSQGDWHFYVKTTYEKAREVLDDTSLESVGYQANLQDDLMGYKIYSDKASYIRVGTVFAGDEQCLKDIVTCDYDGALPKNDSEIMVEQSLLDNNGLNLKIGDTIKIAVGERRQGEFSLFPIKGDYRFGEVFHKTGDRVYKIVGILHNNEPTVKAYGKILRGVNSSELKNCIAWCKFKKITPLSYSKADKIIDKFGFGKTDRIFSSSINVDYLTSKLSFSTDINDLKNVLSVAAILAALMIVILIASFSMIYNAFALSFSEQVKYLGMLSSVGATKWQKKKALYFEGAVLGGIGIPLGILLGTAGTAVMQKILNSKITAFLTDYNDNINYTTYVPIWALLCVAAIGAFTVFVSIIVPVRRTSAVTPIEAIRRQNDIKQRHKIRSPRIVLKLFGVSGDIAYKNMKRGGSASRTVIASIAISVVLFLCCNYFCTVYTEVSDYGYELPYQVTFGTQITSDSELNEIKERLSANSDVKRFYSITDSFYWTGGYSNESDKDQYDLTSFNSKNMTEKYKFITQPDQREIYHIYSIDDSKFNAICKANGIDSKKYYSLDDDGLARALLLNSLNHEDDAVFNNNMLGNTIGDYEIDIDKSADKVDENGNAVYVYKKTHYFGVRFHDFVKYDSDNTMMNLDSGSIDAFIPLSMYKQQIINYADTHNDEYNMNLKDYYVEFGIESDNPSAVETALSDYLSENEKEGDVYNVYYWVVRQRSLTAVVRWLSYGFIFLITLITVFNIINTVSSQIANRKKEFAMLQSVGMTPKEFKRMIMLESAFYGFYGLLIGIPLSLGISKIIGMIVSKDSSIPFGVNVWLYIIAAVAVFVFIGASMAYSVRLIKNNNIIDALKNDTD